MTLLSTNIGKKSQTSQLELAIWETMFNKIKDRLIKLVNRGKYQSKEIELLYQGFEIMEGLKKAYLDNTIHQYEYLKKEIDFISLENTKLREAFQLLQQVNQSNYNDAKFFIELCQKQINNPAL